MIVPADPYFWIATATLVFLITMSLLILFAVALGKRQIGKERKIAPRFILLVITTFYQPIRTLLSRMGKDKRLVNDIGIDVMNYLYKDAYARVPVDQRILVLPHCLRHPDCRARTDPVDGLLCLKCHKCGIGDITVLAERHGIRSYTTNGSSFVKRVIDRYNPGAVFGVACSRDLYEVMHYVNGKGIPMIGVKLLRDGCINTDVDWDAVRGGLLLGSDIIRDKRGS